MPGLLKGLQPYSPHWKNHGTGGGTSFTLDVSSTTNATILIVGGVIQLAGTDYTVSGTTVTTTTSVTSGVEVISAVLYNLGSVTTPAAGSVDFASLGFTSQAQGDILYRDSSTWARLPAGTSGQFLKTQGAGANPAWAEAGGGAWTLIGSQDAGGESSLTQTGLDASTYDAFGIIFSGMRPSSDDVTPQLQFGDSSGIDTGGSDYSFGTLQYDSGDGSTITRQGSTGSATIDLEGQDASTDRVGNAAGEGWSANATLHIGSTGMYPHIHGTGFYRTAQPHPRTALFSGSRLSQIVVDRILFKFSGGNVASGRMTTYGIKHT